VSLDGRDRIGESVALNRNDERLTAGGVG